MIKTKRKKLIIRLIANDLLNTKLVAGLLSLQVDASVYYLHQSKVVFQLMGFKKQDQTDLLLDLYTGLSNKALQADLQDMKTLA